MCAVPMRRDNAHVMSNKRGMQITDSEGLAARGLGSRRQERGYDKGRPAIGGVSPFLWTRS
jgi:hypothetical protein